MDISTETPAPKKSGRTKKPKALAPTKLAKQLPARRATELIPKEEKPPVERDERGQFVPGNNGGYGRPVGAKSKLSEDFIADFHAAWLESGSKALRHMVKNDPSGFVRAAVQLMPKDVLLEARGAGLLVVKLSAEDMAL